MKKTSALFNSESRSHLRDKQRWDLKTRHFIPWHGADFLCALPMNPLSLDGVLWLYSWEGRSLNHRSSKQSKHISTSPNTGSVLDLLFCCSISSNWITCHAADNALFLHCVYIYFYYTNEKEYTSTTLLNLSSASLIALNCFVRWAEQPRIPYSSEKISY